MLRTRLVTRRAFWVAYAIVLAFQLRDERLADRPGHRAVRRGRGGRWVQAVAFGQGRMLYAPVEDIGFGFALVLQSLAWWVFWGRREVRRAASAAAPPSELTYAGRRPGPAGGPAR